MGLALLDSSTNPVKPETRKSVAHIEIMVIAITTGRTMTFEEWRNAVADLEARAELAERAGLEDG